MSGYETGPGNLYRDEDSSKASTRNDRYLQNRAYTIVTQLLSYSIFQRWVAQPAPALWRVSKQWGITCDQLQVQGPRAGAQPELHPGRATVAREQERERDKTKTKTFVTTLGWPGRHRDHDTCKKFLFKYILSSLVSLIWMTQNYFIVNNTLLAKQKQHVLCILKQGPFHL